MKKYISKELLDKCLKVKDLSDDENHILNLLVKSLKDYLINYYNLPITINKGNKIVSVKNNYEILGYNLEDITLSERYTKYIDEDTILRTQMTAIIPDLLREYKKSPSDRILLCPGLVYRRDVVDRTHVAEPHQMDLWLIKDEVCTSNDLINLVELIVSWMENLLGEKLEYRLNKTSHTYTEEGLELEIKYNDDWLELLECGLIGKQLLNNIGIDNSIHGGLALGMGLDRIAMIVKDIKDIRILRSDDERIVKQLSNLSKYKEVSNQPPIQRDLSLALDSNTKIESLTELIMNALTENYQDWIEVITLIEKTNYNDLPAIAKERLGIKKYQSNYLVRLNLRHPARSISRKEANELYQNLYKKLHKGDKGYL